MSEGATYYGVFLLRRRSGEQMRVFFSFSFFFSVADTTNVLLAPSESCILGLSVINYKLYEHMYKFVLAFI